MKLNYEIALISIIIYALIGYCSQRFEALKYINKLKKIKIKIITSKNSGFWSFYYIRKQLTMKLNSWYSKLYCAISYSIEKLQSIN